MFVSLNFDHTARATASLARHAMRRIALALPVAACLASPFAHAEPGPVRSLLEMRQQNVFIQKWDLSCGAAALATLLKFHHGMDVTEKEIAVSLMRRDEYVENPQLIQLQEGFSLLDLKKLTESLGLKGSAYGKMELKDLVSKAPIIVPIRTNGYNHFVIFRGIAGNRVLVADSAWGNRTMETDEFIDSWIDYPEIGHVGFSAERLDGTPPENLLAPRLSEFVMLR